MLATWMVIHVQKINREQLLTLIKLKKELIKADQFLTNVTLILKAVIT